MFKDPYIGMPIDLDYGNMLLSDLPLAMSYVPFQQWKTVYSLEKGLNRGTIFPELDLPFNGGTRR